MAHRRNEVAYSTAEFVDFLLFKERHSSELVPPSLLRFLQRVYSGEGNFSDFDLLGDLDFNARSPVAPTPDAMVAALDASTQARRTGAAPALPGTAGESRVERKRLTEKARRAEMNERLDELAQVRVHARKFIIRSELLCL